MVGNRLGVVGRFAFADGDASNSGEKGWELFGSMQNNHYLCGQLLLTTT